jgi:hypothetical protein
MAKLHVRRRSLAGAQDGEILRDFELDAMDICKSGHGCTLLERGPPSPEYKLPGTIRGVGKRLNLRSFLPQGNTSARLQSRPAHCVRRFPRMVSYQRTTLVPFTYPGLGQSVYYATYICDHGTRVPEATLT